ncbi:MAG: transposase [Deltaproteobacteria bacterium]|nr:transposase [Deltaproteobacteria bacterium]
MARPARKDILGDGPATVHLVTRCHNEDFLLADPIVKGMLYFLLFTYKLVFNIAIYHYCFMDNHLHLILHVPSTEALSKFIHQVLSQLTPVIQDGRRFLVTMRYLDKNPIRAGIVSRATDYQWSSYGYYAYGEHNDLIDPAPEWLGLHKLPARRRKIYRELVNKLLGRGEERLPEMTTWYFIGDPDWVVGKMRKAGLVRPRKPPDLF